MGNGADLLTVHLMAGRASTQRFERVTLSIEALVQRLSALVPGAVSRTIQLDCRTCYARPFRSASNARTHSS